MLNKLYPFAFGPRFLLLWIWTFSGCWAAGLGWADGMVAPYWNRELFETSQVAFLEYDEATEQEDLTIMTRVYGNASEFA